MAVGLLRSIPRTIYGISTVLERVPRRGLDSRAALLPGRRHFAIARMERGAGRDAQLRADRRGPGRARGRMVSLGAVRHRTEGAGSVAVVPAGRAGRERRQ